jgi:predicted ferric reductase
VTHKFFGLFFFFASLHIWLIPSDVSHYLPLRIYMLGISLLGLCAYFYFSLLGKLFVKKFHYLVKSVRPLGDDIIDIIMEPQGEILHFNPGQFIFVSFDDKNIGKESHPFSISSGSNEKNISITIKKSGDYTDKLDVLSVGTAVTIEGPYGVFSYTNAKNNRQIWIAGGIGITPFISMVKTLQLNDGHDIDLYYCLKNKNEAVYLEYLKTMALSLNDRLKIFPHYSSQEGRISAQVIEHQSGGLVGKDIFICAPPPMISSLKSQLLEKGINKKLIHSEEFSF